MTAIASSVGARHWSDIFDVQWLPFQLNERAPMEGVDKREHYNSKFGAERVAKMIPHMKAMGAKDGIAFSYDGIVANTLASHRISEWARETGGGASQDKFMEAIFHRYFELEKNPNDVDVLCDAVKEAGLDPGEARRLLNDTGSSPSAADVAQKIRRYRSEHRVSGVPHFVIGQYSFSGAQDVVTMTAVLQESLGAAGADA